MRSAASTAAISMGNDSCTTRANSQKGRHTCNGEHRALPRPEAGLGWWKSSAFKPPAQVQRNFDDRFRTQLFFRLRPHDTSRPRCSHSCGERPSGRNACSAFKLAHACQHATRHGCRASALATHVRGRDGQTMAATPPVATEHAVRPSSTEGVEPEPSPSALCAGREACDGRAAARLPQPEHYAGRHA